MNDSGEEPDSAPVRLTGVTKRYADDGQPALDQVSLEVAAGEALAVMGPSGSGKSTLLNLVAGLDRPASGTVTVAGQRIDKLSETALARFRRRRIGMIFQFFNLLDDLTVADNVLLPAQLAGMRRARARVRADELLAALRIEKHGNAYPGRLSGGERQRVAIARALVNRPALLMTSLIGTLTLLLAFVAGLGVLNTIVLYTRERVHDLGVFKAVGMTPRQAIAMVVCWVAGTGLVAGLIAVPAGIALHRYLLPVMAASVNTGVPARFLSVYHGWELAALALAGLVIAVIGALLPAGWAARIRTATALRAE